MCAIHILIYIYIYISQDHLSKSISSHICVLYFTSLANDIFIDCAYLIRDRTISPVNINVSYQCKFASFIFR